MRSKNLLKKVSNGGVSRKELQMQRDEIPTAGILLDGTLAEEYPSYDEDLTADDVINQFENGSLTRRDLVELLDHDDDVVAKTAQMLLNADPSCIVDDF